MLDAEIGLGQLQALWRMRWNYQKERKGIARWMLAIREHSLAPDSSTKESTGSRTTMMPSEPDLSELARRPVAKISVVIATLNRQDALCDTLACLLKQDYQDFEVLVVDQTPHVSPRLQTLLAEASALVRYFRLDRASAALARNVGIGASDGAIALFLDDDVVVDESFLANHARNYTDPSVGGVTGLTLHRRDGSVSAALDNLKDALDAPSGLKLGEVCEVSWAATVNLSIKRTVLARIGGFDERLPGNYGEDVDLTVRLRSAGYRLIADTRIRLIHLALQEGGCELRNPELRALKALEAFRCSTYCWLKNRSFHGPSLTCRLLYRSYRGYALNRPSLLNGSIWKKQLVAIRELLGVVTLLRSAR